jgi:hypothetical protein
VPFGDSPRFPQTRAFSLIGQRPTSIQNTWLDNSRSQPLPPPYKHVLCGQRAMRDAKVAPTSSEERENRRTVSRFTGSSCVSPLRCVCTYRQSHFGDHIRSLSLTSSADATATPKPADVIRTTSRSGNIAAATRSRYDFEHRSELSDIGQTPPLTYAVSCNFPNTTLLSRVESIVRR